MEKAPVTVIFEKQLYWVDYSPTWLTLRVGNSRGQPLAHEESPCFGGTGSLILRLTFGVEF